MGIEKPAVRASGCLIALLLVVGTAAALPGGPSLVGKNGVTPVLLFGKAEIRTHLSNDWDHDSLTIGYQVVSSLALNRTLAVTSSESDTLIYMPISISDATEGAHMGVIEVTMDGNVIDSMRTVLRVPWDRNLQSSTWTRAFTSLALVHDDVGPLSNGDLLLSREELSPGGSLDLVVYAIAPANAVLDEIYRIEGGATSGRLAALDDGSGDFVVAETLVRWDGTEFAGSSFFSGTLRFESRYAVGSDGDLYGTLNVSDGAGSGNNTGIYAVDPEGDNDFLRVGTTKMNGVSKSLSAAFDSRGKLWHVDRKGSDYFLSKMNKRGKLPYKKRIAEWNATDECARLVELEALGRKLYAVVLETGTSSFPANTGAGEEIQVWRLDP